MSKTIEITFSPDGQFTVQAHGFRGTTCQQATKALEDTLGEVQERRRTTEYFQTETTKSQQKLGQ
jgi:hypothetical protein